MKANWRSLALALGNLVVATFAVADPVFVARQATTTTSSSTLSATTSSSSSATTTTSQSSSSLSTFSLAPTASISSLSLSTSTTSSSAAASSTPASNTTSNAATFITGETGEGNVVFTITASSGGDLWFRIMAPVFYSWIAFGFGDKMDGALMFIAYQDHTGMGVTLSPRISANHIEPNYASQITMGIASPQANDIHRDGANNSSMIVSGFCRNCSTVAPHHIDVNNKMQPMIWALGGSGHNPWSSSAEAGLRRHEWFGHFTMDLSAARGDGMPVLGDRMVNAKALGGKIYDSDRIDSIHAFLLGVTFIVIYPFGVLWLRAWNNLRLHSVFNTLGLIFVLIGAFTGFYLSTQYNRSRKINTSHQILGLLITITLLFQWTFGFLNHRHHLKHHTPLFKGRIIRIHRYLGPTLMACGLINIALGFKLSLSAYYNLLYAPLVIGLMSLIFVISVTRKIMHVKAAKRRMREAGGDAAYMGSAHMPGGADGPGFEAAPPAYLRTERAGSGPYGGHHAGYEPSRSDIQLQNLGEPPVYHMPPVQPKHMI